MKNRTVQWVRLEVHAALVGLEGKVVDGMTFTLYNGGATWDRAGKRVEGSGASLLSISATSKPVTGGLPTNTPNP